jgi:hypothetical protein
MSEKTKPLVSIAKIFAILGAILLAFLLWFFLDILVSMRQESVAKDCIKQASKPMIWLQKDYFFDEIWQRCMTVHGYGGS